MTITRKERDSAVTYRRYGSCFAHERLLTAVENVEQGDTVEFEYEAPSGIEVSYVGTVRKIERVEQSVDVWVRTNGKDAYLHVNTNTGDVFFSSPNWRDESRLLLFDVK